MNAEGQHKWSLRSKGRVLIREPVCDAGSASVLTSGSQEDMEMKAKEEEEEEECNILKRIRHFSTF